MVLYDHDSNGELTGRVTDNARARIDVVGKRRQYSGEEALQQRPRRAQLYSCQAVREIRLTSVCHESGNLRALQQVRERGDLLHRVSYEADVAGIGVQMISGGMATGLGDEWLRLRRDLRTWR